MLIFSDQCILTKSKFKRKCCSMFSHYSQIEPSAGDSTLVAVSLFLYPINFFYYFLFYTDTVSTLSVLIVYYLAFQRRIKHTKQPTKRKNWEERRSWRDFTSYLTGFSSQQLLLVIVSNNLILNTTSSFYFGHRTLSAS